MTLSSRDVAALRSRISGTVLAAGDDAFAEEHARGFQHRRPQPPGPHRGRARGGRRP